MRLNIKTLEKSVKKRFRSKKAENNPIKAIMIEKSSFALPVVLMIVLGVISYNIASTVVTTKYKESALATVEAVGDYFGLVCD